MKLSELWGKKQVGKQTRKALIFLIPSFILTAIMIFVTFYGQDTGDFSIGIDKETHQKNISISANANTKENNKIIRAKARPIQPISSAAIKALNLGAKHENFAFGDYQRRITPVVNAKT